MPNAAQYHGARWGCCALFALSVAAYAQPLPIILDLPLTTITSGTVVDLASDSITAASGFTVNGSASVTFTAGSRISLEPGFHATAGSATTTFRANIGIPLFPITVTTAPVTNLPMTVDNMGCTSPCTFSWTAGSAHTIATNQTQSGAAGTQYGFLNWSDAGAASHTISVASASYTANFNTQYSLTTSAVSSHAGTTEGSIAPASGWRGTGEVVAVSATPNAGYQFLRFTGSLSGNGTPQNLSMTNPMSVTANFGTATLTSSATSGPGPTRFTMRATSPYGVGGVSELQLLLNWNFVGSSACYVEYLPAYNWLMLADDSGGTWSAGQAPGTAGTVSNSQCTLDVGASSVTNDGTALTLNVSVTFKPVFTGTRNIWVYDCSGVNSYSCSIWDYETWGTYLAYEGPLITFVPNGLTIAPVGGSGSAAFAGTGGGNWTAVPSDTWIHLTSAASGAGDGTLSFTADGNPTEITRNGTIKVNGFAFWIYVPPNIINLSPTSAAIPAAGGSGSFSVSSGGNWTVTTAYAWIHLTATVGSGNGTVVYSVDQNFGAARTGTISVNTQAFTITQAGAVAYTVTTVPANLSITVDGAGCTAPCIFYWTAGQSHTIGVTSPQNSGSGSQLAFQNWSDSGLQQHGITVPSSATTWTANFVTQYQLTTVVSPAGTGTFTLNPQSAGGWYNINSSVSVTATPAAYYAFTGFTGGLMGATNPQNLTMDTAKNVTANFGPAGALAITTASAPAGTVGVSYSLSFAASGGIPPYTWSITSGSVPGLSLSTTGTLSGTPTTVGSYSLTVRVTDSVQATASRAYTVTVATPPAIGTTSLPNGTANVAYSPVTFTATGGASPYSWSITSGALPTGLTLSSSGTLSGTPTTAGSYSPTVQVTDGAARTASQTYTLVIAGPLSVSTSSLPAGRINTAYANTQLNASGGNTPYTWSQTGLPAGLTLSSAGVISGTPTVGGSFSVAVTVRDNVSATATGTLTLSVSQGFKEYIRLGGRVIAIEQ